MRKLAAGNWKMNGLSANLEMLDTLAQSPTPQDTDVLICPPATLLSRAAARCNESHVAIGAQDCHAAAWGAHTGDISAQMLADAGASHVILGHSERREDHGETSQSVCAKAQSAQDRGLIAIVCLGETLKQREAGETLAVVSRQLADSLPDSATPDNLVVAYEPIWAIGTGLTPTTDQIAEVHAQLRAALIARFDTAGADIRLLYGGSVKASNAKDIFAVPHVNGALVGGASLKPEDFLPIIAALDAA